MTVQGEEYLLDGDVLTAIEGVPIRDEQKYHARTSTLHPGDRIRLTISRDGRVHELTITVAEHPLPRSPLARPRRGANHPCLSIRPSIKCVTSSQRSVTASSVS